MRKPLESNRLGGIDLHTHSTASDGTCTPAEIIQLAANADLHALAITDHDTLEGSRIAINSPLPDGLHLIAGLEISASAPEGFPMNGSMHILGYGVDVDDPALGRALADLQEARNTRIPKIVERLNGIGIPIRMAQVLQQVADGSAGRPHVARVMIEMGVVQNVNEAFDRFLSKGQPAYVDKYRIECRRALDLIQAAGGVSVLAHPYLVPGGQTRQVTGLIKRLCDMGLMGIEAYYPEHPPELVALYLEVARQFDLLVTGGSDFHGELIPDIKIGRGRGDLHVPTALYEALVSKISQQKRI